MVRFRNAVVPLFIVNIAAFILQLLIPGFTENFMLISKDAFIRPWIMMTSMFLHGNASHIFFNMYVLLMFGPIIEQRIGTKRFLTIYFISGILASFASTFFYERALGASGAIMGMMGVTIMLLPHLRVLFFFIIPMTLRTVGIIIAIIDIVGFFNPGGKIANIAHLVGLGCGLIYGFSLLKKRKHFTKKFTKKSKKIELTDSDIDDYLKHGRI